MTLVSIVTDEGLNNLLSTGFYGGSGNVFRYMGVGKGTVAPTSSSIALNQECTSSDGNYSRVQLIDTFLTDSKQVKCEGTFDTTNITAGVTLTEVAIFDDSTLGQGTPYCVCQIGDTVKDDTKTIKITIINGLQ